jgi:hypothetical protein
MADAVREPLSTGTHRGRFAGHEDRVGWRDVAYREWVERNALNSERAPGDPGPDRSMVAMAIWE